MKIRTLLTTLLVMFATVATTAQIESGKVYRIVNKMYGTVAAESAVNNTVNCENKGTNTDWQQLWIITDAGLSSYYTIQNVYTGRNLHFEQSTNNPFYTVQNANYALFINDNSSVFSGCYTITQSKGSNWAMHCASNTVCVPWNADAEATNWKFEQVDITAEEIAEARKIYEKFNTTINSESEFAAAFEPLFEDKACTVLKAEYASMSDDELIAAMSEVPADLQQVALKVKNNSWNTEKMEKDFRIYDYKPYSDPEKWYQILYTRLYSPLDNPTGICSTSSRSYTYVFVDEVPDGAYIKLTEVAGTGYTTSGTFLHEGLNIVPAGLTDGYLYIRYICDTDTAGKKLADYPAVKIHIENGYVNGFWSKERGHTNATWKHMQEHMFENEGAIQAKGDYALLSFRKKEFIAANACPEKIEELVGLWDFWNKTQQMIMKLDKYYPWFNNLQLAMSDDSGFMDAGNWRTHYNNNTLNTICNYDLLVEDAGSTWGPNHEIGHNNQYVIEIVGTSEVSNNGFANFVTYYQGTHTSRGQNMKSCIESYEKKIPYILRGESTYGTQLFSMTRMYFQLFLYAHAAGKCPDFYQQLHEKLRYDRLIGWSVGSSDVKDENGYYKNSVNGVNDHLKFAEACCEILQMDLSEFFEAWGFFIPYKNGFVGDYGHHWCYLDEEDAIASKKRMQKYEKKGGHLMFLEDRIRPYERLDGTGMRKSYANWDGESIGQVGKVGQWQDFIDETVKAQGYYYSNISGKIIIKGDATASGALGFKLYNDETGELLTFTNGVESMNSENIASMKIPMTALGAKLRVVAAQADGTDYIIPSASEGPEEMQLEALEASLTKTKIIFNYTTTGDEVGRYYADSLARLRTIYDDALEAFNNKDTSVHSYADWASMLDDEYNYVVSNEKSRLTMKEGNVYYMYNASKTAYYLTYSTAGIVGSKNNATEGKYSEDANKQWVLEYSGVPGEYYLKNMGGRYISYMELDQNIYAATTKPEEAVKLKIDYTDKGATYFVRGDNGAIAIGFNNDNPPTGLSMSPSENRGQWRVKLLTDNSAAFESETITELMARTELILNEVCDMNAFEQGSETVLKENVKANDATFRDNVGTLYNVYKSVDIENTDEYVHYINDLRKALYNVENMYTITTPTIVSNDCKFYWYKIVSDVTGLAMQATSTQVRLADAEGTTDDMLWAVIPAEDGTLRLLNADSETYLRQYKRGTRVQNYYSVYSETPDIAITMEFDGNATIIYTGDGTAAVDTGTGNYVARNNTGFTSGWHFELVSIEENEELHKTLTGIDSVVAEGAGSDSEVMYDLYGRRIQAPIKNNIYIKGNQKIIAE
ncbi:MAG: M60 family metallopeptidase [Bacteroidaceae bacterium]|nr:M60 family metallopeptidase [Bacteroidaceae bacterium]